MMDYQTTQIMKELDRELDILIAQREVLADILNDMQDLSTTWEKNLAEVEKE